MINRQNQKIKCCFIGHRTIENSEKVAFKLKSIIVSLIDGKGVNTFLFGSRSEFDDLCHRVVTDIQKQYPFIERIAYTCRSEWACMENEREENERGFSKLMNREVSLKGYEGEVEFAQKYEAGRASYIERNQSMIDDSDFCVFYYNENYSLTNSKSGTKVAYEYAKRIEKKYGDKLKVINVY